MEGKWLTVLEYASFKKKSISTIRRYIKAKRVKFKEEDGKYLIFAKNYQDNQSLDEKEVLKLKLENGRLQKENSFLSEQVLELKMLVDLYEGQLSTNKAQEIQIPDLPPGI